MYSQYMIACNHKVMFQIETGTVKNVVESDNIAVLGTTTAYTSENSYISFQYCLSEEQINISVGWADWKYEPFQTSTGLIPNTKIRLTIYKKKAKWQDNNRL